MLPCLGIPGLVLPVLHLVKVRTSLGKCVQVLFARFLIPIAAEEWLDYRRILDLYDHGFGLAILGVITRDVDSDKVGQTVFADKRLRVILV